MMAVILFRRRYESYRRGLLSGSAGKARRKQVWITSYPLMIQSGVECGLWSAGAVVSGWFGKIQLAAYQVMNTIAQLGFMTYMSFGIATSIRVANFMGVRDIAGIRRITHAGLHIILLMATVASLIFLFFSDNLIHLFIDDNAVRAYALLLIPPLVLYQYCDGIQLTFVNALRGTSHVKPLLWISLVSYIVVGIPFLLLMAKGFGLETVGVYYSFSGALTMAAVLLIWAFRRTLRTENEKISSKEGDV